MDSKAVIAVVGLGALAALAMAGGGGRGTAPAPQAPSKPPREPREPREPRPTRREDEDGPRDLGWDLLQDERSPIMAFAHSKQEIVPGQGEVCRPCSHLVAAWALALIGREPELAGDWTDYKKWKELDPELFRRVNLEDHDKPWDNIPALKGLLGGISRLARKVGIDASAPRLTPGRWHFVQTWSRAGDEVDPSVDTGHHYLVWMGDGGEMFRVESSARDCFRITPLGAGEDWYVDGRDVNVLTMPSTVYHPNS